MTWPLLSTVVFLPLANATATTLLGPPVLLGAVVLLALPRQRQALMRGWAQPPRGRSSPKSRWCWPRRRRIKGTGTVSMAW